MALVGTRSMLADAQKEGYAIAAFNIENMEMAQAVIWTANRLKSPVICAVSQNALEYASADLYAANVKALAEKAEVPVALHVDHAESEDVVFAALRGGFTSIMIDGSKHTFSENVEITAQITRMCRLLDVPVEGELGAIGGKIDSVPDYRLIYTDPNAAADFVEKTGVNSLAVAIGTAHGIYKNIPRLDYERLTDIRKKISVPLVLHGASGLEDEQIRECIKRGICKINIATELRIAFTNAVRDFLNKDSNVFDPKKYSGAGRKAVELVVEKKLELLGSIGKWE